MKVLKLIFILIFLGNSISRAAESVPDSGEFGKVREKFYSDLGKGDIESIRQFVLPINNSNKFIYGEALTRNQAGPFSISQINRIANPVNIVAPFKQWVGCDVVEYQLLIVRYRYPDNYEKKLRDKGAIPESAMVEIEETYCDLWILGSDGKWRVACDYFPGARLDCQSLGLMYSDSSDQSKNRQLEINQSRQKMLAAIFGD